MYNQPMNQNFRQLLIIITEFNCREMGYTHFKILISH